MILPQFMANEQAAARFAREARALARLNHPNVLAVYDYGRDGDSHILVMELGGPDLGQLLEFAESEARRQGFQSIYLMTNEKMTENQALYARIGYVLFDRQTVHGYSRVLMRKQLT